MSDDLTPDGVLRAIIADDADPFKGTKRHLARQLLAAREALRLVVCTFETYGYEELPEFAPGDGAQIRACLPDPAEEQSDG